MNAKDVLKTAMAMNHKIVSDYISDLSDAELLVRPVLGANHIAWQLGHLITSECGLLKQIGGTPPELPAGFAEKHSKEAAARDQGFLTKAEYLNLFQQVREAVRTRVAEMPDADMDKPTTGNMAKMFPTVGSLLVLIANHELMHAGQFAVVRRKLGKPVLI